MTGRFYLAHNML